jgi:hypothetical protein
MFADAAYPVLRPQQSRLKAICYQFFIVLVDIDFDPRVTQTTLRGRVDQYR